MIIRPAQMGALEEKAQAGFREQMAAHVGKLAPELAAVATDQGVRSFVSAVIDAAQSAGFRGTGPLRFFIESALVLGHRFSTDPQYPWVQEILQDPELTTEDLRADILWRYVSDYLAEVAGPEQLFAARALGRLEGLLGPKFNREMLPNPERLFDMIGSCYPEKYGYVGRSQLQMLVARAAEEGMSAGYSPSLGTPLLTLIMICFGHGAVDDPLYPWIGESLYDSSASSPEGRLERLYDRTRVYLRRVSSTMKKQ